VIITNGHYFIRTSISIYRWNPAVGIYRQNYRRNIQNLIKKAVRWHRAFCMRFYRWNHWGIQTRISVQWRDQFSVRIANGITDRMNPSVIPSAKVNILPLCWPSPPIFLLLLPHPNSPLPNCKQPPPPKKIPLLSTQVIFI
jgi:hypothetical protein